MLSFTWLIQVEVMDIHPMISRISESCRSSSYGKILSSKIE